jgi:hypothetical protein
MVGDILALQTAGIDIIPCGYFLADWQTSTLLYAAEKKESCTYFPLQQLVLRFFLKVGDRG